MTTTVILSEEMLEKLNKGESIENVIVDNGFHTVRIRKEISLSKMIEEAQGYLNAFRNNWCYKISIEECKKCPFRETIKPGENGCVTSWFKNLSKKTYGIEEDS